jgi:hypothetical protein
MRRLAVTLALTIAACVPLTGTAFAQADRDCPDFPDQATAQSALESRAGDPERLDADHDGVACEDFPYSTFTGPSPTAAPPPTPPTHQVVQVPAGAVAAGDGSAAASARMDSALAEHGGVAFVAGLTLIATLAVAGVVALGTAGRMLLSRRRDPR